MGSEGYDYDLTENAESDIDETLSYMEDDLSNPTAASDFMDALEDKIDEICKNPKTGRIVKSQEKRNRNTELFITVLQCYNLMYSSVVSRFQ